jgi:hypothetical protein
MQLALIVFSGGSESSSSIHIIPAWVHAKLKQV